jgi:hypothetical protein
LISWIILTKERQPCGYVQADDSTPLAESYPQDFQINDLDRTR